MADALSIILEMIWHIVSTTIHSAQVLSGLFQQLLGALLPVSLAGPGGAALAAIVLIIVGYFCLSFILGSGKSVLILLAIGIIIVFLMLAGRLFV